MQASVLEVVPAQACPARGSPAVKRCDAFKAEGWVGGGGGRHSAATLLWVTHLDYCLIADRHGLCVGAHEKLCLPMLQYLLY